MGRIGCLWLIVLACGCAVNQSHKAGSVSSDESHGGDGFVQNISVLIPKNLLADHRWDFETATSA
jgi:hypothetical protein